MTGRLAPGAKVDAVMPGLSNSRLPIEPPLPSAPPLSLSICWLVMVVTAENDWSSRSDRLEAAGASAGRRVTIGLATTVISGSTFGFAPCAVAPSQRPARMSVELHARNPRLSNEGISMCPDQAGALRFALRWL